MIVFVKLFAGLKDLYPALAIGDAMAVDIPEKATVEQLARQMKIPSFKLVFVNGITQNSDTILSDKDEIAFVPPVGGG
ncbi:MAG: MoaD/ThiS family protein [Phycisphaerae bacterium]|nr:MoaD/ThiS family protein [Phycisphaerae bacterium]